MISTFTLTLDTNDTPELGRTRTRIRKMIRAGYVVSTPRQCGATTALLEVIYEISAGSGTVAPRLIVVSVHEGKIYEDRYRGMFPDAFPLRTVLARAGAGLLNGRDLVYVDGLLRCPDTFWDECERSSTRVVGVL